MAHTGHDLRALEGDVKAQQAMGVDVEMIYRPQLAGAAPYLSAAVRAASFCPRDGMANPFAAIRALLNAARRLGAKMWAFCEVDAIEVRGGPVISSCALGVAPFAARR